jgi:hypothetical protein
VSRRPYPLQWPPGQKRTPPQNRMQSRFGDRRWSHADRGGVSPYEAAKELLSELRLLGASHVTITSQLPTRNDGLPYADGRCQDPGAAVWFVHRGHERVFACDRWFTVGENLRAIALSVGAMRGLSRWGMADVEERAFAGFAALPAGEPERPAWREVFGVGDLGDLPPADLLSVVKGRHRKMIAAEHPDVGGDTARAAVLNVALAEATAELAATDEPKGIS